MDFGLWFGGFAALVAVTVWCCVVVCGFIVVLGGLGGLCLLVSGLFDDYFVSVWLMLVGSLGLSVCGVAILVFVVEVWVEIGRHFSETGGLVGFA